jgi:CheY-like chemotaxis protein
MACILIADDNPLSLRFLAEALGRAGHACTCASDGAEAAAIAASGHFDLLLLDARMPRLGGAETLHRIRHDGGASRLAPALATTADTDPARHAHLLAAGFLEVLPKPLTATALQAAVAKRVSPSETPAACGRASGLDDERALAAAGGDPAIVDALRELLATELAALPGQFDGWARGRDLAALRECLHRLDASAGFCGAVALADAIARLRRAAVEQGTAWPEAAIADFLAACDRLRNDLAR